LRQFALALPAGARLQKIMRQRLYRIGSWGIILLPGLLFLAALAVPWIPEGMGLFSSGPGPWYQPVTALLFFTALFYGYPITRLCLQVGGDDTFLSPTYYVALAIYSLVWMWLLRSAFSNLERKVAKIKG
jgi:hypothetical protein